VVGNTFLDGGMGHNNPSKLAYDEVVELHQGKMDAFPLRMLLNIGTGSQAGGTARPPSRRLRYVRLLTDSVRRWTDGREIPYDLQRLVGNEQQRFNYHRLDVHEGLQNIAMDEWKKNHATLQDIEAHTRTYLNSSEAQGTLVNAAKQLVEARVERERLWPREKIQV